MTHYVLHSRDSKFQFELVNRVSTLGRNPGNAFHVPDPSVSSFHAEVTILPNSAGLRIRDLQSTNGTLIDGEPVNEAILEPGHILQLGEVQFDLEAQSIEIKVPKSSSAPVAEPAGRVQTLDDGTLACSRNGDCPATHQAIGGCAAVVKCPGYFSVSSLRSTRLAGGSGGSLLFCPDCNARCEPIPGVTTTAPQKKGLLARLTQTVQLQWKR